MILDREVRDFQIHTVDEDLNVIMNEQGMPLIDVEVAATSVSEACRMAVDMAEINVDHPTKESQVYDTLLVIDSDLGDSWILDAFRYNPVNPPELD